MGYYYYYYFVGRIQGPILCYLYSLKLLQSKWKGWINGAKFKASCYGSFYLHVAIRMTKHVACTWLLPGHVYSKHYGVECSGNEPEFKRDTNT